MIVGFPYQTPEVIQRELDGLLALRPTLNQFLIYGPTPGTPFYRQVMEDGLLDPKLAADNERYYRSCTGFKAMVRHPSMAAAAIEAAQKHCFREDFKRPNSPYASTSHPRALSSRRSIVRCMGSSESNECRLVAPTLLKRTAGNGPCDRCLGTRRPSL